MIRAVTIAVLFVAFAVVAAVLEDAWMDPVIRVLRSADAPTEEFVDLNITIPTNATVELIEVSNSCLLYSPVAAIITVFISLVF